MGLFSLIGGIIGGGKQKKASKKAAQQITDASNAGIAEIARQNDLTRASFAPYEKAGFGGLDAYLGLVGLNGAEAQQKQIDMLRATPLYQSLYDNGEEAVLQNSAATGDLRGGNAKRSLAEFGRDTLSQLIEQQLGRYGGLASMGQQAAGTTAGFGADAVNNQNTLRLQGAGARAGDLLTRGGISAGIWNNIGGFADNLGKSFLPGGGGIGSVLGKLF